MAARIVIHMTLTYTPIDDSYVKTTVDNIRRSFKLGEPAIPATMGPLVSLHLQSNRPDNFTQFLDDLEGSLDDPTSIEVIVKIDDVDEPMNALLPTEVSRRPFAIKYISTPLDGGFFELWRSMNDMLAVSDPNAYFLWNMNDEMAILNKGWDRALRQYVGLFPDHIFRLRTSLFRARNYCDYWEAGFAPETSAINTRRWIEIGGDWNPCLGPDSFQQCVAYYFAYHGRFDDQKPVREIPIHDFAFKGEGACLGLEGERLWKRMRGATKAWYRLMSYKMQMEASRRAQKLRAHICAHDNRLDKFSVKDDPRKHRIVLTDVASGRVIREFPYGLSWLRITMTNLTRSPYYLYYGGGGHRAQGPFIVSALKFAVLRYDSCEWMYQACKRTVCSPLQTLVIRVRRILRWMVSPLSGVAATLPAPARHVGVGATVSRVCTPVLRPFKAMLVGLIWSTISRGYPRTVLGSPYAHLARNVKWTALDMAMAHVIFPERFQAGRFRSAVLRCVLLRHWYQVEPEEILRAAEQNVECRYFMGLPRHHALPSPKDVHIFQDILKEQGEYERVLAVASEEIHIDLLPLLPLSDGTATPRLVA